MEFFQPILKILDYQVEIPAVFGVYHIICLALTVVLTAFAAICGRHHSAKTVRRVVLITAIVVAILEIYKQINYTFGDGSNEPNYLWYAFPWQFCSTPLYIGLLAGITRKGRLHDAFCCYLATYAVFAGAAVMLYPGDVFIETLGINIQTMICHGSMITIGIYLLYTGYVPLEHKTILKALPVFAVTVGMAMLMNEIAYRTGLLETDTFNMFFISPYCDPHLPVYSTVQALVPYPLCLIIYIAGFTAAGYLLLLIGMGISRLFKKQAVAV